MTHSISGIIPFSSSYELNSFPSKVVDELADDGYTFKRAEKVATKNGTYVLRDMAISVHKGRKNKEDSGSIRQVVANKFKDCTAQEDMRKLKERLLKSENERIAKESEEISRAEPILGCGNSLIQPGFVPHYTNRSAPVNVSTALIDEARAEIEQESEQQQQPQIRTNEVRGSILHN